jgi:predicted TIM-barrel fold metal-dependent hydrolase
MNKLTISLLLLFVSKFSIGQKKNEPIIDMHMHARVANHYGPPPLPICAPAKRMPFWDPRDSLSVALENTVECDTTIWSPLTDAELMYQTIAVMKRYNMIGMLGGKPELVSKWMAAAPGRFIPGFDFRLDKSSGTASASTNNQTYKPVTPEELRTLFKNGTVKVFGEVLNQYAGILPDDQRMDPYWAVAEELDIPVGIHIGPGGPAEYYFGNIGYRAKFQSALTLEEVLIRHPKLRVYIMHAGYPMLDDLLALLFSHPQVYVEVSMLVNVEPRAGFYRYLKAIVDAGYDKRIMFGSDQMIWPGIIEPAIKSIENAPFLSKEQKRDIFYNNAARFLRLSQQEINEHHKY